MKEESWVTLSESDAQAWEALVLAKSLRRTFTSRKLTILVTENVSQPMKIYLQKEFDLVVKFDTSEFGFRDGTARKGLAKLWVWNLKVWTKCVFLDPNSIVLQNSDSLFAKTELSACQSEKVGNFGSKVFVFRPNDKTFEDLLEKAERVKCGSCDDILNGYFRHWITSDKSHLDSTFSKSMKALDIGSGIELPNIIMFDECPWEINMKKYRSAMAKNLAYKWTKIFVHEVLPGVNKEKRVQIKEFLQDSIQKYNLPPTNGPAETLNSSDLGELRDAIAVIGLSCRFPGANTPEEYWSLLAEGRDPIRAFPTERPNWKLDDGGFEAGFLKCPVDEFDAKFFGISPREAPFVDPQQRILLEVIWESLENANINPQILKESDTGVFMGVWQQDYDRMLPDYGLTANDFHHRYLGNAFSATASRISYFLGLYGPNYSIESGCSSSSSGVHLACNSLRRGETNLAISSGVNLVLNILNPFSGDDQNAVVLSKDHRCKTFDEAADGFVRAEGCGSIVLKRYADARRDGDNILALIRGTALNNDGPGTSFGTPNAKAQERVFREALKNADVLPSRVSYVEAHGTGTMVGDPTEMYAIGQVYSEGRQEPLFVSSVKTNIGHAEACAGMAGLIKVILCMKNNAIPPLLHLKSLNPRINLDAIPAKIPTQLTEWKGEGRIASVSSFSMSGTNVHMVIQEPPLLLKAKLEEEDLFPQLIQISAKTDEAVEALCQKYATYLEENPLVSLREVAHSANMGRANLSQRVAVVAKDRTHLLSQLQNQSYMSGKVPALKHKVGFLFTGQGSQYFGMAKNLYETFPAFSVAFDRCDDAFYKHLNRSLKEVAWTNSKLLEQTVYCQPAIFCTQYALVQLWKSFNITPDYVLGHSVGEFAAAVCAGILSFEDAMKLVVERSRLVTTLEPGSMMAVKASLPKVSESIQSFTETHKNLWVDIAAVNSQEEVVISGSKESVKMFGDFCLNNSLKFQVIPASHAFHSREMDGILPEFGAVAGQVVTNNPSCHYISGTLARPMELEDFSPQYWQRHLRDSVRFSEAIKGLWSECKVLVEIGAQPILLGLSMGNVSDPGAGVFCPSLRRSEEDRLAILTTLGKLYVAGIDIDWKLWFGNSKKQAILPTYPFQRQKYWFVPENDEADAFNLSTALLHPILGRLMPAPLSDTIFCHRLQVKDLSYVNDHKVAERIIVPGAAYLECIMAAGREVLQGGGIQVPLTVENLSIKAALELEKACTIQTVVSSANTEEGIRYEISIHRQASLDQADKWKRHADGTFSPTTKLPETPSICLEETKARLTVKDSIAEAYRKIAEMGIQFGPRFQSIISAWSGASELLTEIELPADSAEYICHPIVIDAMIQTYAFRYALTSSTAETGLQLPIGIKKFVWLSKPSTKRLYAHTNWENGEGNVNLYSEQGEQLAIMEGLELVKTTTDSFLRALNTEAAQLPQLFEEIWKPTMNVTRARIDCGLLPCPTVDSKYVSGCLEDVKALEDSEWPEAKVTDEAFLLFLLRGIQECSWSWPDIGEHLLPSAWKEAAPAVIKRTNVIESFFKILSDEGYLTNDQGEFRIAKILPAVEECDNKIRSIYRKFDESGGEEVFSRFMKRCGQHFTSVLLGEMTPLAYMFPEDTNEVGAYRFYSESKWYNFSSYIATSLLLDTVDKLSGKGKGTVRILEVGAGSGKSSGQIIDKLSECGIPVHYTFTDISPLFVAEAKKKLSKEVTFGVLNIEEDPLSQGFAPHQYDIVMAMQVIHAVADVKQALTNIKKLLRPDGVIIMSEQFQPTYKISLSFGMLDGWWRFNDFRKLTPIVDGETWKRCLTECGYNRCSSIEIYEGTNGGVIARNGPELILQPCLSKNKSWLLVGDNTDLTDSLSSKFTASNRNVIRAKLAVSEFREISEDSFVVNPQSPDNFVKLLNAVKDRHLEGTIFMWDSIDNFRPEETHSRFCAGLLHLCQAFVASIAKLKEKPKLFAVTRGVYYIGDAQAGNPNAATSWGMLKSFSNENPELSISLIDTDQDVTDPENEVDEVFAELWNRDREMFVSFREGKKFVQRFVKAEKPSMAVNLPNSDRFKLVNPESHSFADLSVVPATKNEITGDNVEVCVHACALNFRDLFLVLQPEGFDIPDYMSKEVGLDIAGVVTAIGPEVSRYKVGDEVFGFTNSGGLASHNVISEKAVMRKPKDMTFTSASTVPVAFLTVFYSLVECAKMDSSDRILIHVATGGVGLAAIQVANHIGAEIYATAGSKKKRAYLRSLGIKNVYHSRNIGYGEGIVSDSNGKGVTVVLNSLTGPNFKETSLKACTQGARFVEIGKVNIWKEEEVTKLRPDVKYFIVDLAEMAYQAPEELEIYTDAVDKEFQGGVYSGLPHDIFPLDLVREAFHHFQEAKHIGKIVVTIPKPSVSVEGRFKLQSNLFNKESTYLITGGLGGLGMEVTKWMTTVGAKNIVLAGRSAPKPKAQELIDQLNQHGCNVIVIQSDVGNYNQCVNLLEAIQGLNLPPIRGIMHAAGVISDSTIPNQSWDKYTATLSPKVYGGWNLHMLTMGYDLEFFLMFSSAVAILGLPGQSNHAGANRFLDSLAHYRNSLGLPATSINFGAWSEVGAAAHIKLGTEGALGIKAFSPKQGIMGIEKVMRERRQQITICEITDWNIVKQFIGLGHYLDDQKSEDAGGNKVSEELTKLLEDVKSAPAEHKQEKIKTFLEVILRQTLRLPENEAIDPDQNFTELGVDSLMAMEMRNRLQGVLGDKTLTVSALQENRTTNSLSKHMADLMNFEAVATVSLEAIIEIDIVLPEDIKAATIAPLKPSQYKHILLTGATGHLGSHFIPQLAAANLTVHCLVRGESKEVAEQRLTKTLKQYDLSDQITMERLNVIVGDVGKPNMGLSPEAYGELSTLIDAIVHCAIKSNHLESYADGGEHSMRNHNVFGMVNVLRFAGAEKTKPVLYASSLLAASKADSEGNLVEEYPTGSDKGLDIRSGYILSKFIGEKLACEAERRGIPVTVLRYASIFGNSNTGYMPPGYNHAWNILLSCIRVRKFPSFDQNGVPIIPVDTAADISTKLFLNDSSETGVYNMTMNSVTTEEDIKDAFSLYGVDGEFVPFSEWRDLVFEETDKNLLGQLSYLYENEGDAPRYLSFHPMANEFPSLQINRVSSKLRRNLEGIDKSAVPAKEILERHLNYYYKTITSNT